MWVLLDLVEAAVGAGRHAEAVAHVRAMRDANLEAMSPRLALFTAGGAAMTAPVDEASRLFDAALAIPGVERWPFDLARVQLAYGQHLRRTRAMSASRAQLTSALETFQRLGAKPWAARARNELRAAGRTAPRGEPATAVVLSAQELEIATLAASGLSNKDIGQQLFLSHRTVGANLYRIFPKLGITSRAALRDALATLPPGEGRQ